MHPAANNRQRAEEHTVAPIEIDVWSDVICPWCWVGKRRLDAAVAQLGLEHALRLRFRAFELSDRTSVPGPLLPHLARKFGARGESQVLQMVAPVVRYAEELGLSMDFERAIAAPTFDAHRVIQAAARIGLGHAVIERLHRAHFAEGENIADHASLRRLAAEAGMGGALVDEALSAEEYAAAVNEDEALARRYGVNGVPFFILDGRYAVEGAQSTEVFVKALSMLRDEKEQASAI